MLKVGNLIVEVMHLKHIIGFVPYQDEEDSDRLFDDYDSELSK